jgi:carbon storage regulator
VLILTRRTGETICIGEKIRVTVAPVVGGRVRLGLDAPADMRIDREEVSERRKQSEEPDPPRS